MFSAFKLVGSSVSRRFASTFRASPVTKNIIRIHINDLHDLLGGSISDVFRSEALEDMQNYRNSASKPSSSMIFTSVLRKRRLKMKKHKLRKRRKAQRALKIKIGK
ncbi:DEBR0S5_09362g1_1 [Brettanomyces bruxellensis]|uniref:DEBR0S5_09362g1_1 n=1 Tax=Dekkera bruxellensis TaxID=5007 RepID=A0A3F2Y814_DEKBR|nr:uncharacterized protein BRETT_000413 [Brettanomyces bruxellensis]QOU20702.1 hypothetical protein BRETT_000413 [Brettanomyces bruxellensis]VUG19688.1 DEBR0S5_09362g1_1 [Brettanomyces bruxellensis]